MDEILIKYGHVQFVTLHGEHSVIIRTNIQQWYLSTMMNLPHRFARRHRLASIHTISVLRCDWLGADTRSPPPQGAASPPRAGGDGRM